MVRMIFQLTLVVTMVCCGSRRSVLDITDDYWSCTDGGWRQYQPRLGERSVVVFDLENMKSFSIAKTIDETTARDVMIDNGRVYWVDDDGIYLCDIDCKHPEHVVRTPDATQVGVRGSQVVYAEESEHQALFELDLSSGDRRELLRDERNAMTNPSRMLPTRIAIYWLSMNGGHVARDRDPDAIWKLGLTDRTPIRVTTTGDLGGLCAREGGTAVWLDNGSHEGTVRGFRTDRAEALFELPGIGRSLAPTDDGRLAFITGGLDRGEQTVWAFEIGKPPVALAHVAGDADVLGVWRGHVVVWRKDRSGFERLPFRSDESQPP